MLNVKNVLKIVHGCREPVDAIVMLIVTRFIMMLVHLIHTGWGYPCFSNVKFAERTMTYVPFAI